MTAWALPHYTTHELETLTAEAESVVADAHAIGLESHTPEYDDHLAAHGFDHGAVLRLRSALRTRKAAA